jgi:hypothetical protein
VTSVTPPIAIERGITLEYSKLPTQQKVLLGNDPLNAKERYHNSIKGFKESEKRHPYDKETDVDQAFIAWLRQNIPMFIFAVNEIW